MTESRYSILTNLLLISGIAVVIGLIFSIVSEVLAVTLFIWALIQAREFKQLLHWAKREQKAQLPESPLHWGELFDILTKQQREQIERETALDNSISRLQNFTAVLPDALVVIDSQNNLEWWNLAAERLLGLNEQMDKGRSILNMLRDPRFIRYYQRKQYAEPLTLVSPLEHEVQLQYQITVFGEGNRLLLARDISRVMRLEQTRQDFVANASHELRTPLTVIRGYLETFLDNKEQLPTAVCRGLDSMRLQSQRMENLVTDLLLLSRLESNNHIVDEHPIYIQEMLKNIIDSAKGLSADKVHKISMEIEPEYDLVGQEAELHSAFSNIIYNAVRYTPSEGHIHIRWRVTVKGGYLSVKDTGVGIAAMHISRLTERFYRVDESRSSDSGGTGLGLAIVKHALARHGACLKIKSKLGKGSIFSCCFPPEMVIKRHNTDEDITKC